LICLIDGGFSALSVLGDFVSTPVIMTALCCPYLGYALGERSSNKKMQGNFGWRHSEAERLRLDAENRYIEVLRRELANMIVSDNPSKMVTLYRKAWAFEQEMQKADAARVQAEFEVLTQRYPLRNPSRSARPNITVAFLF